MRLAVVLAALLATASGCEVDCYDGGELETRLHAGEQDAAVANQIKLKLGYKQGRALTRTDGEKDGDAEGFHAGYSAGFDAAYGAGYADAYASGENAGASNPAACSSGASAGYAAGTADGYSDSAAAGRSDGYDDGYGSGYSDGAASCSSARVGAPPPASDANPDDLKTCYARGYDQQINRSARAARPSPTASTTTPTTRPAIARRSSPHTCAARPPAVATATTRAAECARRRL